MTTRSLETVIRARLKKLSFMPNYLRHRNRGMVSTAVKTGENIRAMNRIEVGSGSDAKYYGNAKRRS